LIDDNGPGALGGHGSIDPGDAEFLEGKSRLPGAKVLDSCQKLLLQSSIMIQFDIKGWFQRIGIAVMDNDISMHDFIGFKFALDVNIKTMY